MFRTISLIAFFFAQAALLRADEKSDFVFRIEWGSKELGGLMEQDVIVFSVDDLSILRPAERNKTKIDFVHFWHRKRLRWALINNFGADFDRISVSCYGLIPEKDGSILNIKNMLSKRAYVKIENGLSGCKYEFYKVNKNSIDSVFYHNSQTAESHPIAPGDYLLVVSGIQKLEPLEIRTFSISQEQINTANNNFHPVKGSPERFCGVVKLDLNKMDQADAELKKQIVARIPRSSILSGALNLYYREFHPLPEYSFEYKEILEYKDPLDKKGQK